MPSLQPLRPYPYGLFYNRYDCSLRSVLYPYALYGFSIPPPYFPCDLSPSPREKEVRKRNKV